MPPAPAWLPDWRDAGAYRFERLDRAGFGWEWLRRDPAYLDAARAAFERGGVRAGEGAAMAEAAAWGLVAFERPELAAPAARPMWLADIDRQVLVADAAGGDVAGPGARAGEAGTTVGTDALALDRFGSLVTIVKGADADHVLLCDGWRRLRIDVMPAGSAAMPFVPRWRLDGVRGLGPRLLALERLAALVRARRFCSRLWPRDPRTRRWILALRAHDALVAGEGTRAIAGLLGDGGDADGARWRIADPSLRLRGQRLAALARSLPGLGFAVRHLAG